MFRTLTAKLATMGVLMATISMIFTATLISEGAGLVFRGLFAGRAAESACFDLYIGAAGDGHPAAHSSRLNDHALVSAVNIDQVVDIRPADIFAAAAKGKEILSADGGRRHFGRHRGGMRHCVPVRLFP